MRLQSGELDEAFAHVISRELGLSLHELGSSLDDPSFDRERALLAQREHLARRAEETAAMIRANSDRHESW